jgi:hypothetical protein
LSSRALLFGLCAATAFACSGQQDARNPSDAAHTDASGTVEPATAAEREVLGALTSLPGPVERRFGGLNVHVSAPYHSASGRQCRQVTIHGPKSNDVKLACRDESEWVFVPNVLAASQAQ